MLPSSGRGAVERQRAEQAVAGLLEDDAPAAHVEAEPAELAREVRREHAGASRAGRLQLGAQAVVVSRRPFASSNGSTTSRTNARVLRRSSSASGAGVKSIT